MKSLDGVYMKWNFLERRRSALELVSVLLRTASLFLLFYFGCFGSLSFAAGELDLNLDQPRKNKYQKSRLTHDESEATADKRKLLLTTGEDKAIDLDFDANAGPNGISYGN